MVASPMAKKSAKPTRRTISLSIDTHDKIVLLSEMRGQTAEAVVASLLETPSVIAEIAVAQKVREEMQKARQKVIDKYQGQ